jgi:hypothetical protein
VSGSDIKARLGRLFTLGEPQTAGPGEPLPQERFRGPGWSVTGEGESLILHYLSGEMAGGEKTLAISAADAEALSSCAVDLDALLRRRHRRPSRHGRLRRQPLHHAR